MTIPDDVRPARRALFTATIFVGSALLFLIQPMVARMALPRLGGAPNVWNSALLVYQALLLGGYFYAHLLSRLAVRWQAMVHLTLLACAALTLPVGLAALRPTAPGWEVLWVPLLLALSIGPVFVLVSAQAPLMQRWFAAVPAAGAPWPLYAASNLGSFAGLIGYPLLAEPWLGRHQQSLAWSLGYGVLIVLTALTARARWHCVEADSAHAGAGPATGRPEGGRIVLWLALAAVPSGLMMSTTTHLTTDIFAMPLLWVIPLGLYLLSLVVAFAAWRLPARAGSVLAPPLLLLAGGFAMVSRPADTMTPALASVALLLVVSVALHTRLYDARPDAERLTLFYLTMAAGGAFGGAFAAVVAPVVFDWVWEHPLLVLAAALLIPLPPFYDWRRLPGLDPEVARAAALVLLLLAAFLAWLLLDVTADAEPSLARQAWLTAGLLVVGMLLAAWRWAFAAVLAMTMIAQGGAETFWASWQGVRTRSYFGIYTVRDHSVTGLRTLAHGTTLHGQQSTDPARACEPLSYYGPGSGAAIALDAAQPMFGRAARIGVVGLGTGTLAAFDRPGERWTFFEIDRAVVRLSRNGTFTYLARCAPGARIRLGDARLALAEAPRRSFDLIAVDAFSSDAIPQHLLTDEAIGIYLRALAPRGVLLVHISNRYFDLEPVLAAAARARALAAALRHDVPQDRTVLSPSSWVALSRDPASLARLEQARPDAPWQRLEPPAPQPWTDDHASILPYVRWRNILGTP